jgi:hypothetical protein
MITLSLALNPPSAIHTTSSQERNARRSTGECVPASRNQGRTREPVGGHRARARECAAEETASDRLEIAAAEEHVPVTGLAPARLISTRRRRHPSVCVWGADDACAKLLRQLRKQLIEGGRVKYYNSSTTTQGNASLRQRRKRTWRED